MYRQTLKSSCRSNLTSNLIAKNTGPHLTTSLNTGLFRQNNYVLQFYSSWQKNFRWGGLIIIEGFAWLNSKKPERSEGVCTRCSRMADVPAIRKLLFCWMCHQGPLLSDSILLQAEQLHQNPLRAACSHWILMWFGHKGLILSRSSL